MRFLKGLSPRGRGKPHILRPTALLGRSIPAWAGETKSAAPIAGASTVYPRVGGGNPVWLPYSDIGEGLSPRGRGKLVHADIVRPLRRSIPAWAGETTQNGHSERR